MQSDAFTRRPTSEDPHPLARAFCARPEPTTSPPSSGRSAATLPFLAHPLCFELRRLGQGLSDNAELLGLFVQGVDLLGGRFGGFDLEHEPDVLEADRRLPGDAQGSGEVHVAFGDHFYAFSRDLHRRGDHLAGDLGARGERSQEEVAGAGSIARSSGALVGLGLVGFPAHFHGAGYRRFHFARLRAKRYPGGTGLVAVLLFQGFLDLLQVHAHRRSSSCVLGVMNYTRAGDDTNLMVEWLRKPASGRFAEGEPEEVLVVGVEVEQSEAGLTERGLRRLAGELGADLRPHPFARFEGYLET